MAAKKDGGGRTGSAGRPEHDYLDRTERAERASEVDHLMEYTWASIVACVIVIAVELLWFKTGLFRKVTFYVSYAIILFFQVLVDGWLTKLSAPIVLYNEEMTGRTRFPWDIPVEDYLFGFAMIVLTMLLWERWAQRHPDDAESRRTAGPLIRRR